MKCIKINNENIRSYIVFALALIKLFIWLIDLISTNLLVFKDCLNVIVS